MSEFITIGKLKIKKTHIASLDIVKLGGININGRKTGNTIYIKITKTKGNGKPSSVKFNTEKEAIETLDKANKERLS